ncbi:MAG: hypothetical protein IKS23_05180 [Alphaproteobacteria bacterium]|nr:hypothetical protein [Alphaproteobacteria bacterium]
MVKRKLEWYEYLIFGLLFLFVINLLTTRLIDVRVRKICPIVQQTRTISSKEAEVFLTHWQEYVKRGYMAKVPEDFAFDGVRPEERLPWIVQKWFEKRCIDPKRFYYTEQRFRSILKAQELLKHTQRVIDVFESQIEATKDETQKQWYRTLIEEQKQMSKVEGISDDELAIVAGREGKIREILR